MKKQTKAELEKRIEELEERISSLSQRFRNGRMYLMEVNDDEITVEQTFLAFGWDKNGCE